MKYRLQLIMMYKYLFIPVTNVPYTRGNWVWGTWELHYLHCYSGNLKLR